MNTTKRDIAISFIVLTIVGCSTFSISHIIATKSASFSLTSIVLPALASIGGMIGYSLATLFMILKICSGYTLVAKGVPSLVSLASASAESPSHFTLLLNIGVPIAMATAFILHPVGNSAWVYTLFWIIPVICEILRQQGSTSLFMRLLTATFIAHAVGSVIFLYSVPSTPATWIGLLTIVPAERLVFASGATLAGLAMIKIKKIFKEPSTKKLAH